MIENYLSAIKTAPIFSGIGENEIELILHCLEAETKSFQKREYILRSGETVESAGLLISGSALIVQEDFWGNRNIMSHILPGQLFAETFACSPDAVLNVSVAAEETCTVMFINVKRIITACPSACAHHSRIIRNLLSELAGKNLKFNEKVTHMSQRTTRAKLKSYLSSEARRHNSAEFVIPFTRQQLADYLSVDRSGLSLELCKMRDEGIITFNKNHFILHTAD